MNTVPNISIARRTASFAASLLITFTGLQLIVNYALPEPTTADSVLLAGSTATPQR